MNLMKGTRLHDLLVGIVTQIKGGGQKTETTQVKLYKLFIKGIPHSTINLDVVQNERPLHLVYRHRILPEFGGALLNSAPPRSFPALT